MIDHEPGERLAVLSCPQCGSDLVVEYGDDPGQFGVIGRPRTDIPPVSDLLDSNRQLRRQLNDMTAAYQRATEAADGVTTECDKRQDRILELEMENGRLAKENNRLLAWGRYYASYDYDCEDYRAERPDGDDPFGEEVIDRKRLLTEIESRARSEHEPDDPPEGGEAKREVREVAEKNLVRCEACDATGEKTTFGVCGEANGKEVIGLVHTKCPACDGYGWTIRENPAPKSDRLNRVADAMERWHREFVAEIPAPTSEPPRPNGRYSCGTGGQAGDEASGEGE